MKLLKYMRVVILQDAVMLMQNDLFKTHSVFKADVFKSKLFLDFSEQLLAAVESTPDPDVIILSKVIPVLSDAFLNIQSNTTATLRKFSEFEERVHNEFETSHQRFEGLKSDLNNQNHILICNVFIKLILDCKSIRCCF